MGKALDVTGKKFGQLVAQCRTGVTKFGAATWQVVCSCGTVKTVRVDQLTSGNTVSCGCHARTIAGARVRTHGMTNSFEFRAWTSMRQRCNYQKHPAYAQYGGRGITVCKRWGKFENFLVDMGLCTMPNGSIERKDNSLGYAPSNCYWRSKSEQAKKRRNVPMYNGLTLPELAVKLGVKYSTLRQRISAGWPENKWGISPQELGTRRS